MLTAILMSAALIMPGTSVAMSQAAAPAAAQTQTDAGPDDAVRLEDVEVTGGRLEDVITDFVNEVAEPNRRRGLARWNSEICVGVANLSAEAAEYLADRISTVAEDIGLQVAGPGCTPNILVVATGDGNALARGLVERTPRAFRMGGSGMDRGGAALRDFIETDRPVRWWQMSLPVDSQTGDRAVRIPGDCNGDCTSALDAAPQISVFAASRLRTQIVDNLIRTVVIVDVDQVATLGIQQLADYIAMVSFAQIDPDADTRAYATILNVFDDPGVGDGITEWDRAYLDGLYAAERTAANGRANRSEIVSSIRRAHGRIRAGEAEDDDAN